MLPPGRVTSGANTFRSALLKLHRATAPPPLQIIEAMLGVLDNAALAALCQLGVPEAMQRPMTMPALADAVGADVEHVERLVRFASTQGWVRITRRGRVKPTRRTAFLRADHPGGWRAWVEFASSPEVIKAVAGLASTPATGASAFEHAQGTDFFTWMAAHPKEHAVFDRAMDAGGRMHALALSAALPWTNVQRVCDVGGGTGTLLTGLLGEYPHLRGVLLDLPEVVARAAPNDRIEAIGGDASVAVPSGCDTYLLINVLHDWGDEAAVTLLTRIAEVLDPGGQLIVVDGERSEHAQDSISSRTDLLMLVLTGTGKERTTAEFTALAARAKLRLERSVRLASGDRAHVFALAGTS